MNVLGFIGKPFRHKSFFLVILLLILILPAKGQNSITPRQVNVQGDQDFAPYEFLNENGEPDGFNVDLIHAIAEVMGLEVRITLTPWSEARHALEAGQTDMLLGMFFTLERSRLVDFSSPHSYIHHSIFVRRENRNLNTLEDLKDREIIVQSGDIMHDLAVEHDLTPHLITVDSPLSALRLLASGKHDCALLSRFQGLYFARRYALTNIITTGDAMSPLPYCFAIRKGDEKLVNILNEGLAIIRETGQYRDIYSKWFGVLEPDKAVPGAFLRYFALGLVPVLLLLIAAMAWSWSLRKQVRERTREIEQQLAEKKKVEQALRESQRSLATLLSNLPGMAYRCRNDEEWTMEFVSEGCLELTGYQPSDLILNSKVSYMNLIDPRDREYVWQTVEAALEQRQPFRMTYRIRTAQETEKWVWEQGRGVWDEERMFLALEGFISDITDRIKAEEQSLKLEKQMQQAQKLESLGVLAGGIAHDFNNLLVGILGNASLAKLEVEPDAPVHRTLEQIEKAGQRAADLCRQLLAYSGKGRFVLQPINLSDIVEEMGSLISLSVTKKAMVRYNLKRPLSVMEGDATQIRQVVMNLILNASDALGDQTGTISLTTGCMECDSDYLREVYLDENLPGGCYVYLEVSDTGCGMDRETLRKIFDPFFTTKFTGRGLGLAAVLGIVRGHKGALKVYSEPGKGTSFKVLFPCHEQAVAPISSPSHDLSNWRGTGTVLVVDDEEAVRNLAQSILERYGFEVLTASNGRLGLQTFQENADRIVLVLLDMTMPGLSGEETFMEIQRIRPNVPVILSSGYNEQDVTQSLTSKGLAGFIQKPYQMTDFLSRIKEVLEKGR